MPDNVVKAVKEKNKDREHPRDLHFICIKQKSTIFLLWAQTVEKGEIRSPLQLSLCLRKAKLAYQSSSCCQSLFLA